METSLLGAPNTNDHSARSLRLTSTFLPFLLCFSVRRYVCPRTQLVIVCSHRRKGLMVKVLSPGVILRMSSLNLRRSENIAMHNSEPPRFLGILPCHLQPEAHEPEVLCHADVESPTGSLNKELDGSMSPGTSKDEGGCLCVPVCLHDDCVKAAQRLGIHANRY